MYTSHGHQIPGTPVEGERPKLVARCGGPRLCRQCKSEVQPYTPINLGETVMLELGPQTLARIERAIALGLEQRPLSQAQQARAQIININAPAAIKKVMDVIECSPSVMLSDHGQLFQELIDAGIGFYYNPDV